MASSLLWSQLVIAFAGGKQENGARLLITCTLQYHVLNISKCHCLPYCKEHSARTTQFCLFSSLSGRLSNQAQELWHIEDIPSGWLLLSQPPGNIAMDYISFCLKKFMQKWWSYLSFMNFCSLLNKISKDRDKFRLLKICSVTPWVSQMGCSSAIIQGHTFCSTKPCRDPCCTT